MGNKLEIAKSKSRLSEISTISKTTFQTESNSNKSNRSFSIESDLKYRFEDEENYYYSEYSYAKASNSVTRKVNTSFLENFLDNLSSNMVIIKNLETKMNEEFSYGYQRISIILCKIIYKIIELHEKKFSINYTPIENEYLYDNELLENKFSIQEYIMRLIRVLFKNTEVHVINTLILFDNFLKNCTMKITKLNVLSIITICMSFALKAHGDYFIPIGFISGLSFISIEKYYEMEMDLLSKFKFNVHINEKRYFEYKRNLYNKIKDGIL